MKKWLVGASVLLALFVSSCGNKNRYKELIVSVKTDTVRVYGNGKSAEFNCSNAAKRI